MNEIRKIRRGDDVLDFLRRGDFREGWNQLVDITQWWRQFVSRREDREEDMFPHPEVVDVANRTGAVLEKYSIVQLGGPLIEATANLLSFQQSPGFTGIIPTHPPDLARFAIMLEPLGPGASGGPYPFGRAVIAGAVAVQVNVTSMLHGFAIPVAGNTSALQSTSAQAGAVILTQPTAVGLQWLYVGLGRCCAISFASVAGSAQCTLPCPNPPPLLCGTVTYTSPFGVFTYTVSMALEPAICAWYGVGSISIFPGQQFPLTLQWFGSGIGWLLSGVFEPFGGFSIGVPSWDCASSFTVGTSPAVVTITVGDCSGGGGGGGGVGDCCAGSCGDAGVSGSLSGTMTSPTGAYVGGTASFSFNCITEGGGGSHIWEVPVPGITAGTVANFQPTINCGVPGQSGVPYLQWVSGSGSVIEVAPSAGYQCSPFSAVYNVNDGAGNTCTITVTG